MSFAYIHWDVDPEIIRIFGVSIRYYGLLFVSGLILAVFFLNKMFKENHLPNDYLEKLIVYAAIGIFAGARLGHCLFYEPEYYLSHPIEMILPVAPNPEGGYMFVGYRGLASHGGAIGLMIALFFYSAKTKQRFLRILDYIGIVAPLTGCFIRLANLMNSEIIGNPTQMPWAFIFEKVDQLPRHPAQLYEAIVYLCIFGLNWFLYKRIGMEKSKGLYFGITLTLIFGFRFFVEFFKERQSGFEESMLLDMGQLLSIPFIVIGLIFVAKKLIEIRNKK